VTGSSDQYRPGACNIGEEERRRRGHLSAVSAAVAVAYTFAVILTTLPSFLLLGLFVPITLGVEWGIESRRAFCARLAFAGEFRFRGQRGSVEGGKRHRRDVATATRITAVAALIGATLTTVVYGLTILS
jgi:hypothetical protein